MAFTVVSVAWPREVSVCSFCTSLSAAPTLALRASPESLDNNEDVESLAKRLDTAVFAYLQAYANAHGQAEMRHKHHELVHLADQLRKDKLLLWCFTAERKHIVAKEVMTDSKKRRNFALGTVARMLSAQISSLLDHAPWRPRLNHPSWDFEELAPGARMSRGMRLDGCVVVCGNPLFIGRDHAFLILVVACIAVGDRFGVLGHQCVAVGRDAYSSEWTVLPAIGQRFLEPADAKRVAGHWRFSACRSRLTVLH